MIINRSIWISKPAYKLIISIRISTEEFPQSTTGDRDLIKYQEHKSISIKIVLES